MVDTATNILGMIFLFFTAIGAYVANELRKELAGSELASVWRFIGMGIVFLFIGAVLGGAVTLIDVGMDPLKVILVFAILSTYFLAYGLWIQLSKVR